MLKLLTLVLSLSLLTTSSFAGSNTGLKDAIQELNYALNVEWDQKDMSFYSREMNAFRDRVEALNLQGSKKAILSDAVNSLPASAFKNQLSEKLSQVDVNKMSDNEIQDLLIQISKNSGSKGASWNGSAQEVVIPALIAIGVVVFIVLVISAGKNSDGATNPNPNQPIYQCGLQNTCFARTYGPGFDDSGMMIHGYDWNGGCYQQVCGYFRNY
jgi:hypothetical protein